MTTTKAPAAKAAPVTAVVPAGGDIFGALSAAASKSAATKRTVAPGSLATPTEIGPGVIATMQGTMLLLAIETGPVARENAEITPKLSILAQAGPGFGRTMRLPGSDLRLAVLVALDAPKGD